MVPDEMYSINLVSVTFVCWCVSVEVNANISAADLVRSMDGNMNYWYAADGVTLYLSIRIALVGRQTKSNISISSIKM